MFEEGFLLDCPQCSNKITIPLEAARDGRRFPCPICSAEICFQFTEEELAHLLEVEKKRQQRDLAKSFPLAFGRI